MPKESIPPATVVWFRRDLRLSDTSALEAAVARGGAVVAAWVHAPGEEGDSAPGAAAAPFFRVFNPTLQGGKFDPRGDYVRTWVPELGLLPDRWIHRPWEAPSPVLSSAGVVPGKTYPRPIVDHAAARLRALAAMPRRNP